MGIAVAREAAQRHNTGLPGRLRAQHHGQAASRVCALQPRPEGEDEEDRLLEAG